MTVEVDGRAPYAPATAVIGVVERYRDANLPEPIDADVLERIGVAESLSSRTLQALKLLDLVDEGGQHLEGLRTLGRAHDDEYREQWQDLIRSAYKPVTDVIGDPSQATGADIANAFRSFEPRGQRERMVRLFTGLCEYAGILHEGQKPARGPDSDGRAKVLSPSKASRRRNQKPHDQSPKPPPRPDQSDPALRTRYIEVLLEKVATQENPDEALLDRIERALQGWTEDRHASPE